MSLLFHFAAVNIKGQPFDILREQKKTAVTDKQPPIEGAPIRRVPSGGNLKTTLHHTSSGGNEGGATGGVPVNEAQPLRRKHSVEFKRKVETQPPVQRQTPPPVAVVKPSEETTKVVEKPVLIHTNGHSEKDPVKPKITNGDIPPLPPTTNGTMATQPDDVSVTNRKPPNILIYTGPDDTDPSKYDGTKLALEQCLRADQYVIYRLNHKQILSTPWVDNCALIVIASGSKIRGNQSERFMRYLNSGGMLLSFGGAFAIMTTQHQGPASYQQVSEVTYRSKEITLMALLSRGGIPCGTGKGVTMTTLAESQGQPVLAEVKIADCKGKAILSQVGELCNVRRPGIFSYRIASQFTTHL